MLDPKIKGTGTIYYRADRNQYCGQVIIGTDPKTGKPIRKTLYAKRKKDLQAKIDLLKSTIVTGTYRGPTEYTVGSWLDYWIENYVKSRLSSKSYEMYTYIIRVHLKPAFGGIKLEDLKTEMIEKMLDSKMYPKDGKKGLKIRTIRYIKQTLTTSLRKAVRRHLINYNVAEEAELPVHIDQPRIERAFTLEEMQCFIKGTADCPYHNIWDIGFLTGLRRGEILGLKWKDIDFENCRINLCRQVVLQNNKPILTDSLKTEGSSQEILVMPLVIERLKLYKLKQREELLKLSITVEEDDLIFTSYTKLPFRPDVISHIFTEQRKMLGLRDGLSLHSTRHTFATLGIESGMETPKMKDFMRHTDLATTMGYVGKMKDTSYRTELEKLSKTVESIFDDAPKNKSTGSF